MKVYLIILIAFQNISEFAATVETINGKNSSTISQAVSLLTSELSLNLQIICISVSSKNKEKQANVVHEIMSNTQAQFIVQSMNFDRITTYRSSQYFNVFIVDNYSSFQDIFKIIRPKKHEYEGNFLVVVLKGISNDQIQKILIDFWSVNTLNVNVLVEAENDENYCLLYTYFPFTKNACSLVHPVVWKTFKNGAFRESRVFYPDKTKSLNNCPLKAATFHAPPFIMVKLENNGSYVFEGIDFEILTIFTELLQFRTDFTVLPYSGLRWGAIYANGSSRGAIEVVKIWFY